VVALDDFGAGPSNLVLLQRLAITGLKLAPELVAALDDEDDDEPDDVRPAGALVRGLIDLGRTLGLTVVAQGVETEAQVQALRALGCEFAQGPFLGRESELPAAITAAPEPAPLWAPGTSLPGPDPGGRSSL
jgi:EAL domain-containing protein (putative c-di-GMP-specific phosphodiesterase class I)